jgi:hypothetical protein
MSEPEKTSDAMPENPISDMHVLGVGLNQFYLGMKEAGFSTMEAIALTGNYLQTMLTLAKDSNPPGE